MPLEADDRITPLVPVTDPHFIQLITHSLGFGRVPDAGLAVAPPQSQREMYDRLLESGVIQRYRRRGQYVPREDRKTIRDLQEYQWDVVVAGGGLAGAAIGEALARRDQRVLVLARLEENSAFAASKGEERASRIDPEAPSGIYSQWATFGLERMRREFPEVTITEGVPTIIVTDRDSKAHKRFLEFSRNHKVDLPLVPPTEVQQIYGLSAFSEKELVAFLDPHSVTFNPRELLNALYQRIRDHGGEVLFNSPITQWETRKDGKFDVHVGPGSVGANRFVMAAGAWTSELLYHTSSVPEDVRDALCANDRIERLPVIYVRFAEGGSLPELPATLIVYSGDGSAIDGGLPRLSNNGNMEVWAVPTLLPDGTMGRKAGLYYGNKDVNHPMEINWEVQEWEKLQILNELEKYYGKGAFALVKAEVCLHSRGANEEWPKIGAIPEVENAYMIGTVGFFGRYMLGAADLLAQKMLAAQYDSYAAGSRGRPVSRWVKLARPHHQLDQFSPWSTLSDYYWSR
jgi:hypothetical protein